MIRKTKLGFPFRLLGVAFIALVWVAQVGCESHTSGVTQTEAKTQIERLFNLYKAYVETNHKGPPNEKELREFAKKLTEKDRDERLIGKDIDGLFISPRDQEPRDLSSDD